ncbi:MAG: prenyltransferase, partial [Cyclobacteriaceae bacterium]
MSLLTRFPVKTIIRLTRVWNLLIIVLAQFSASAFLISESNLTDWRMLVVSFSTVLVAAAGYVIND